MNKKLLTVAIAGTMAAPMAAQAVKYKISGQVNRAVVFMDDGEQSDVRNVDSSASGTRFRFRGSEDLGNGMKVGMYYELQTSSQSSASARPDQDNARNSDGIGIRQANVWFSGNWGKLTIGQGDGAGNGATEADLSGTSIATAPARNSYTGGMAWRAGDGSSLGVKESNTYNSYDAFSRHDNIRYDSPALGPVTVAASVGNDQIWEIAGRANTALGGGQLSAGLFYGSDTGSVNGSTTSGALTTGGVTAPASLATADKKNNVDSRYGGSLAYMFSQGTNLSGHYAVNKRQESFGSDGSSWHLKLGHKWGANAASIAYYQGQDVTDGFKDTGIAVGFVHSLKKANTQLYAAFYHNELDTPTGVVSAEDHNAFVVGARVKFD